MTDIEFEKAIDICEKLDFFGGCRAGRELWFGKPVDVQDRDIQKFAEDVTFLKDFISRQKAEIERLIDLINEIGEYNEAWVKDNHDLRVELKTAKTEAIKEFAERLKYTQCRYRAEKTINWNEPPITKMVLFVDDNDIDSLVKEMTEDK